MAEVVGLVSAITAIAATGFKISRTISTIAEEFGTVGPQLRAIATNTQAVAWILDELKVRLLNANGFVANDAVEVVRKIIAQCQIEIDDINECIAPISRDGREFSPRQRLKWLLAKPKLTTKMAALDSLKLTLSMYICAIRFMDGNDFKESMHDEIQCKVSQSEQTRTTLLHAEYQDQKAEMAYQASHAGRGLENDGLENDGKESITSAVIKINGGGPEETGVQTYQTPPSDFELGLTISNDQFVRIADHIRLQRMVSGFALKVVNRAQAQDMPAPASDSASSEAAAHMENSESSDDGTRGFFGSGGFDNPEYQGTGPRTFNNTRHAGVPPPDSYAYAQPGANGYQFGPQQSYYDPPMPPPPPPPDPLLEALRDQIDALKAEKASQKAAAEQAAIEDGIRQEVEEAFKRRMEDMKVAQEEAIEKAKVDSERATRERLETERKAEAERQRQHEETMRVIELEAREKMEKQRREFEERQREQAEAMAKTKAEKRKRGLMKYFAPAE
ncbi:hypothetical protein MAPG_06340 [Magnaporthiopsis poae ATCC 64411]|uniref:Fungal N-terminal domain-containing protein n=1 Tax=Magnaporthiopsis poae (strain ATCC 64411 / 73-15) TaxID=644358 RepID=A0A0C4E1S1_MAGP6|nr:hypothetical protein MAPG_06340 [Magnaporthiopsis poae ATCC 64411]